MTRSYEIRVEMPDPSQVTCAWKPLAGGGPDGEFRVSYPVPLGQEVGVRLFFVALPMVLGLGYEDVTIRLVSSRVPSLPMEERKSFEETLCHWGGLVRLVGERFYGRPVEVDFELDVRLDSTTKAADADENEPSGRPGLFFGGGVESLLVLAELLGQGEAPVLLSYLGEGWTGSDPAVDTKKVAHDVEVAQGLGLRLARIETDAYAALVRIHEAVLAHRLRRPVFFPNAVGFSPIVAALCVPAMRSLGLSELRHGSEIEHVDYDPVYCLSPVFLSKLKDCLVPYARYRPVLGEMRKLDIVQRLWALRPDLARLQASCFWGGSARWCQACEKCFRSYALLRASGAAPVEVELDEGQLFADWKGLRRRVASVLEHSLYHKRVYESVVDEAVRRGDKGLYRLVADVRREVTFLKIRRGVRRALPEPLVAALKTVPFGGRRGRLE